MFLENFKLIFSAVFVEFEKQDPIPTKFFKIIFADFKKKKLKSEDSHVKNCTKSELEFRFRDILSPIFTNIFGICVIINICTAFYP